MQNLRDSPLSWVDAALDLVTGARCVGCDRPGRLWCTWCARRLPGSARHVRPSPCPTGLAPTVATGPYDGVLQALVLAHKERQAFGLARPLGDLLAQAVRGLGPPGASTTLVLVPVPSRRSVVVARGHDPMLRVARRAAQSLRGCQDYTAPHTPVRIARLLRLFDRPADQAGLGAADRQANLEGVLAVRTAALRTLVGLPVQVVVCDDVLTTGATAREAQRALEAVGLVVAGIACVAATRRRVPLSATVH